VSLVQTFLGVWERKPVSVILPLGNHLCLWGTLTLNRRPNNNKVIITVVSGAVVFVAMNIIIKLRRGSGVHNVRRHILPHGPSLKE
jgi:hypothetical protein